MLANAQAVTANVIAPAQGQGFTEGAAIAVSIALNAPSRTHWLRVELDSQRIEVRALQSAMHFTLVAPADHAARRPRQRAS